MQKLLTSQQMTTKLTAHSKKYIKYVKIGPDFEKAVCDRRE
jgi:hypothetical protein